MARLLCEKLGVTRWLSVPVNHCAHAYATVVDSSSFGRVAYSGDCRPSDPLAAAAKGSDMLIHEATFEDDLKEEAVIKKHSTVSEALLVGKKMDAKVIVLTHFSQRYPELPELNLDALLLDKNNRCPSPRSYCPVSGRTELH